MKINELEQKLKNYLDNLSKPIDESSDLNDLLRYQCLIFNLNEETKENNLNELLKILNKNNIEIISNIFFSRCLSTPQDVNFIIDFLILLNENQAERKLRQLLLPTFKSIVLRNLRIKIDKEYFYDQTFLQELSFLTICLLNKQIINPDEIIPLHSKLTPFFAHLMNPVTMHFDLPFHSINCDPEKHRQNILQGENNTDPIYKVLREDDSKSLMKMTQMLHFNYEQVIPIEYYEKFSILVTYFQKVTILEYCAFYGSLECFKILFNNGTSRTYRNLAVFAAAGGNIEIFKLLDSDEHSKTILFDNELCLNVAIAFHRQQIIEYLVEYKNINIQDIFNPTNHSNNPSFMNICKTFFQYSNFIALIYFWKRGIDPCLFIEAASSCGCFPAVRFILNQLNGNTEQTEEANLNMKNPLLSACLSGNEEIIKSLLSSNLCHVTDKVVLFLVFLTKEKFFCFY